MIENTSPWPLCKLRDIAEFRNGLNFTQSSRGQRVKVVGVGDFGVAEELRDFSETGTVTIDGTLSDDDVLKNGDLLFVRSNGNKALVGRCVYVHPNSERVTFSGFTIRARINSSKVDPWFISKVVRSPLFKKALYRPGGGSSISNLSQGVLSEFEFPLPPLPEQRKIADILRTWDGAIQACERLRFNKIQQATWFRTNLFTGKIRLSGFTGEWRKLPLAAVLTEHGLRSAGTEQVYSVSVHKGLINQIEHLGRSFAAKETTHYNRVLPGDIVYTKSPTGDFPLGIIKQSKLDQEVIVSPLYGVFTPATRDLGVILDAYFRSPVTVRNYLARLVQKGAKNTIAITNSRFLEGELTLPLDPNEHRAIAEIIEDADAEIAAIERRMDAFQRQKRGLMQKLLTGQWRVRVDA